jgi:hypothetical protein
VSWRCHRNIVATSSREQSLRRADIDSQSMQKQESEMRRLVITLAIALMAATTLAGPVAAKRDFGSVYINDAVYRVFGNKANVPDGTGTDPFAIFEGPTKEGQLAVAEFAPGSAGGHHGGRWAVSRVSWANGVAKTLVTSWGQLEALVSSGDLTIERDWAADFRCPVLGNPQPLPA